jgi:hypothetical protein
MARAAKGELVRLWDSRNRPQRISVLALSFAIYLSGLVLMSHLDVWELLIVVGLALGACWAYGDWKGIVREAREELRREQQQPGR